MNYPKIKTVYRRDPATKYRTLLEGEWAMPEFGYLADCEWVWTEKVDGTNIRIVWDGACVKFGGKTDRTQLYVPLLDRLQELFPTPKLVSVFGNDDTMTFFGEGYGARIQKGGGNYISDGVDFILFDVLAGEDLWLAREDVEDIAEKLGIKVVPIMGMGTLFEAVDCVTQHGWVSIIADKPIEIEGLVMRPLVELRNRRGGRIITKIKGRDFA